jgi:hypothetical protein
VISSYNDDECDDVHECTVNECTELGCVITSFNNDVCEDGMYYTRHLY